MTTAVFRTGCPKLLSSCGLRKFEFDGKEFPDSGAWVDQNRSFPIETDQSRSILDFFSHKGRGGRKGRERDFECKSTGQVAQRDGRVARSTLHRCTPDLAVRSVNPL